MACITQIDHEQAADTDEEEQRRRGMTGGWRIERSTEEQVGHLEPGGAAVLFWERQISSAGPIHRLNHHGTAARNSSGNRGPIFAELDKS